MMGHFSGFQIGQDLGYIVGEERSLSYINKCQSYFYDAFFLNYEEMHLQQVKRAYVQCRHGVVKHLPWTSRVISVFYDHGHRENRPRLHCQENLGISFAFSLTLIVFLVAVSKVGCHRRHISPPRIHRLPCNREILEYLFFLIFREKDFLSSLFNCLMC